MIGYVHDATTMLRVWDTVEKGMITASNVIFDEGKIVGNSSFEDVLKGVLREEVYSNKEEEACIAWAPRIAETHMDKTSESPTSKASLGEMPAEVGAGMENVLEQSSVEESPAQHERPENQREPDHRSEVSLRRSCRIQANAGLTDASYSLKSDILPNVFEMLQDTREPESYTEAASDARWQEAMKSVYSSLKAHGTFTHVKSYDRRPISSKWIFRIKQNADGSNRYKARLDAREFEQVPRVDYGGTFAPVAWLTTFPIYLLIALELHATIYHLDVVTTFLNPEIDDETAIAIPDGIEWLDPVLAHDLTALSILQLNKALHGRKQAPLLWYKDIAAVVCSLGFTASGADPNLYLSSVQAMMILLYVDDILLCAHNNNQLQLTEVIEALQSHYEITNLKAVKQYLRIAVNQAQDSIQLGQSDFVANLLTRFGLQNCNGHTTPLEPGSRSHLDTTYLSESEQKTYQSLVEGIMYLMLGIRPDLAYSISVLSKNTAKPQQHHLGMAKWVLLYLKQTQKQSLPFSHSKTPKAQDSPITGFTDSDWAGDTTDRHSTSGYIFLHGQTAISWKAKKQSLIALSTTEAEYIEASEASKEAIWLRRILHELFSALATSGSAKSALPNAPIVLFINNQGTIKLIQNPRFHELTKHIEIKHHYIRETFEPGEIDL